MSGRAIAALMFVAGAVFIYAAIKNISPPDVVKQSLRMQQPRRGAAKKAAASRPRGGNQIAVGTARGRGSYRGGG